MSRTDLEAVKSAFGIGGTNVCFLPIGSADDLMDAFGRYIASAHQQRMYTLAEFKDFIGLLHAMEHRVSGLEYYTALLESYLQRVPDLGWERCARQVWPLLTEAKLWIDGDGIPLGKVGVRPIFQAGADGAYEIRASLCNHSGGFCDCGVHK